MKVTQLVFFSVICAIAMSCADSKKSVYFNDQKSGTIPASITIPENVIQKNDLLSISVTSLNAEASALYNAPNIAIVGSGNTSATAGYLVGRDGDIQFPILGTVKAEGLTENELRVNILKALVTKKLLVDPIVSIRHLNFKVTVLGEVKSPTVVTVPNEKITLLEAIGLAGDITIYGKKDNVMIIREVNGQRNIERINLNSSDLFTSSYYYLQAGDIVYVEPNKAKVASSTRLSQSLPLLISMLSLVAVIVTSIYR